MSIENKYTLHCFAGDMPSLGIILLAKELKLDVIIRYLKPINVAEKLYKPSLTKSFPMLQTTNQDTYFIERTPAILRHLSREASENKLYDEKNIKSCLSQDILFDFIYQEILPSLFVLNAEMIGVIEIDNEDRSLAIGTVFKCFPVLIKLTEKLEKEPQLIDYFLIPVIIMASRISKKLNLKWEKNILQITSRINYLDLKSKDVFKSLVF